jgi:hypothetical protein
MAITETWDNNPQNIIKFAGDINQVPLRDVIITFTSNCQTNFPNQTYIYPKYES